MLIVFAKLLDDFENEGKVRMSSLNFFNFRQCLSRRSSHPKKLQWKYSLSSDLLRVLRKVKFLVDI